MSWSDGYKVEEFEGTGHQQPDDQVIDIAEHTLFDVLEANGIDYNKALIKSAPKWALNRLLNLILGDFSDIWNSVENAIHQLQALPQTVSTFPAGVVNNDTAMAPIENFATKTVCEKVVETVRNLVFAPFPILLFDLNLLLEKEVLKEIERKEI